MRLTEDIFLVGSWQKGLSGPFDCEVYALAGGEGVVLVDAGAGLDTERIVANLQRDGLDPEDVVALLLTHEHSDHACGAMEFRERFGTEIICHAAAKPLVEAGTEEELGLDIARRSGVFPPDFHYRHCPIDRTVVDGQTLAVGGFEIRVLHTPGHSPGSTCYLVETAEGRAMFTGDVVLWGGLFMPLNYSGCDLNAYRRSLAKLANLGVEILLPGHGQFTLRQGQRHLDRAIDQSRNLYLPAPPQRFR